MCPPIAAVAQGCTSGAMYSGEPQNVLPGTTAAKGR
jgi:hypothetical protein